MLLDAYNAYPQRDQWSIRLDEALATGLPLAIEQDLHWYVSGGAPPQPVVAHDDDALAGAPTLDSYFFARIKPILERALAENERDTWPLITLNLDFKDNTPAHLDAVWALLGKYEAWLTTATRTVTPSRSCPGPCWYSPGRTPRSVGAFTMRSPSAQRSVHSARWRQHRCGAPPKRCVRVVPCR